jgi:hypothetical protein
LAVKFYRSAEVVSDEVRLHAVPDALTFQDDEKSR